MKMLGLQQRQTRAQQGNKIHLPPPHISNALTNLFKALLGNLALDSTCILSQEAGKDL